MRTSLRAVALAAILVIGPAELTHAQIDYFFQPDLGNWHVNENWQDNTVFMNMFVPDATITPEGERANIDNGGTAFVDADVTDPSPGPGAITLGSTAGSSGTLEIRSGGTLHALTGAGVNGGINVGVTGQGTLRVLPGGTLTAAGPLVSGSNSDDLVRVGGTGAGTATLSAPSAIINGTTQVFPNADFSTTGNVIFGSTANYNVEVTSAGSGMINVGDSAQLGGSLGLNFTDLTPAVGNSWTILEADTINGSFSNVTFNAPSLPVGQGFVVNTSSAGGERQQLTATLEEVLVLEVNRNTGAATVKHPGASSIELDSYFIGSDAGSLNPAAWNSFEAQGVLGGDWLETDARPDNLGEVKPSGASNVSGGASFSLGSVYDPFAGEFGEVGEDLQFVFSRPSDGAMINGTVTYTGTAVNTLLLQVDPSDGQTYLRNTSDTAVEIDGYHVLSESNSLSTSGWNPLGGEWLENDSSSGLVAEFNSEGFTMLAPGAQLDLGQLFDPSGTQDLEFQFLMEDEDEGMDGVVLYEALAAAAPGDYNNDGMVDAADYTVWRDGLGSTFTAEDYNVWKENFGQGATGSTSASAAVPEPATWLLAALVVVAAVCLRHRHRSGFFA